LLWTCKSTRQLPDVLAAQGFQVSNDTVGRLIKHRRYTLQRTLKTEEGARHPGRGMRSSGMSTSRPRRIWPLASRS
jgi:Rhodopirellula transposase DDE domain